MRKSRLALCAMVGLLMMWAVAARAESPMVKLDGRGCEIPLLHAYETEYASLREELEAISAPVGISSEKIDGCVFTVDQIAASDGYLLAFFTITSDETYVMPQDQSIYGWHTESGTTVFLDAILDGNENVDDMLSAIHDYETFFEDEHTIVGWGLFRGIFKPVRIPEVCEVKMTASPGTGAIDLDLDVSFTLDRSTKLPGFIEGDLNVPMVFSLQDDRGATRNIRFTHVSMSPLGNLLTLEEDVIGQETWLNLFDEAGVPLIQVLGQGMMYDASPQHPIHVETFFAFLGGRDGRKLTVAPGRYIDEVGEDAKRAIMPLDVPLPYTHTYKNGQQITILELQIDRNRLLVKYRGESYGRLHFSYFYDEFGEKIEKFMGLNSESKFDRGTGIWTMEMHWPPEKGAQKGERITQKTLGGLKSVEFSGSPMEPMMDYAVEIELTGS